MIISADANRYSPPEYNVIKDVKCDLPLVLVTRLSDYVFNEELLSLDKYALICMCEYGWNFDLNKTGTHKWGQTFKHFDFGFNSPEWVKFDNWIKNNPPVITLKRELLDKDVTEKLVPIDYPAYHQSYQVHSEEEFNNRPIELFNFWGRSSEERVVTHAGIWLHSSKNGAAICDNLFYINDFLHKEDAKRKWVSINTPHYTREMNGGLSNILIINGLSKLSLSQGGCGSKCFRDAESSTNSIMVLKRTGSAYAFPWIHNQNCIMYDTDPMEAIEEALINPNLYSIYKNGIENWNNYRIENYKIYIENTIKNG